MQIYLQRIKAQIHIIYYILKDPWKYIFFKVKSVPKLPILKGL